MFGYMTTDFSTVEMLDEQETEAEGISCTHYENMPMQYTKIFFKL